MLFLPLLERRGTQSAALWTDPLISDLHSTHLSDFLMAVGSKCARVCGETPRGIDARYTKQRVGNQNKIETLLFRCKIKILFGQMRDFQTLEHIAGYFLQCCHPRLDGLGGSDRHNLH